MHAEDASHMRRVVLSDQAIQIDPPSPSTAGSSTIGIARIMNGTFALNASRHLRRQALPVPTEDHATRYEPARPTLAR